MLLTLNGVVLFNFTACSAGVSELAVLLRTISVFLVIGGNGVLLSFNAAILFLSTAYSAGVSDLVVLLTLTLILTILLFSRLPHWIKWSERGIFMI